MSRLALSLTLIAVLAACAEPPTPSGTAPIVLISIDTLRSDRLSVYGYAAATSPQIDRFAAGATLFERAYSSCPLTLPSHATMFTGHLPPQHGVRDNRGFALDETYATVAETAAERGYATAGFVSSMVLRGSTGIGRGFAHWEDGMDGDVSGTFAQRRGDETLSAVFAWLDTRTGPEPVFLFVHFYDPHTPYDPPEPWRRRFDSAYDAEIAWTDNLTGRLLDGLRERGLYRDAWILLLSDHGEGLGDHVESEHGLLLYRETLQVPLLLKRPGQDRGERREDPVGLVDVMPTLLEALGQAPQGLPGRSLLLPPPETPRGLYAETLFPKFQYGFSPLRSAIRGNLHYIEAPREELYDMVRDPGETTNLMRTRSAPPSLAGVLRDAGEGREARAGISEEEQRKLAALGYVGGADVSDAEGPLPDPKDRVGDVEELFRLVDAVGKRPDPAAELRLVGLLRELGLRNESLARTVGNNLLLAGRADASARVLEPFAASREPATRILLGQLATTLGSFDEAEGHFRTVLGIDAGHPGGHLGMGILTLSAGGGAAARPWLERALELDAGLAEGWNALAVIDAGEQRWDAAIEGWKRAVEIDPALSDAWFNLVLAYEKTNRPGLAAEARRRVRSR